MEAALYTRLSHDPGNDRLGVQRQERECRELAERAGWRIQVYEDDDLSAYRPGRRPAFERMITDIEAGRVGAIVVAHPDRLYRHPRDLERLVDVCERRRVPVQTVMAGGIDLSTASGRMVARMLGAASRHEVERTAERIRSKHLELARAGKRPGGGSRPYGYDVDHLTVIEVEAERIREAAARVLAGESLHAVCRDWITRGVPSASGRHWSPAALRKILVAARISGRREMFASEDGKRLQIGRIASTSAEWPPIISTAESDRLRTLFATPGRLRARFARTHLLTGIARCGACNAALVAHGCSAAGARRIGCSAQPGDRGCGQVSTLAEPLERLVEEAVLRRIESGAVLAAVRHQDDEAAAAAQQELMAVEARRAALARRWARGELADGEWDAARGELQERKEELEAALTPPLQAEALGRLGPGPIREAWQSAPLAVRRQVIAAVTESVLLARSRVRGDHRFDPDRLTISWRV